MIRDGAVVAAVLLSISASSLPGYGNAIAGYGEAGSLKAGRDGLAE
jgi:hypothetical protein